MKKVALYSLIERMASLIRAEERKKCTSLGLQNVHLQALIYLSLCNKYSNSPAALANYLGMTRGTVSQTLLLLEKKGFIKKNPDINDRRIIHLELLPAGWEMLEQATLADLFARAAGHLIKDGNPDCEMVIAKVLTALQKANQSHSFGLCKTCRHFSAATGSVVCGLTKEPLSQEDSEKICQEHIAA